MNNRAVATYTRHMSADLTLPTELDVLEQARQLARPVTLLRRARKGQPVASWGGEPSVPLPPELVVTDEDALADGVLHTHWVSVEASALSLGLTGCLSVYLHPDEDRPLVLHHPEATLHTAGSRLLYAHARMELPHVDALFRVGPPALQQWMARLLGQDPAELLRHSDIGAHSHPVLERLDQTLRAAHPMWRGGAAAQLGGWCWGWPDEAWDERERRGQQLVLTTFEDSEPWVEVWWTGHDFEAVAHLT